MPHVKQIYSNSTPRILSKYGAVWYRKKKKKLAYVHSSQQQESYVDRNVLSTVALLDKFRYNVEIDGVIG